MTIESLLLNYSMTALANYESSVAESVKKQRKSTSRTLKNLWRRGPSLDALIYFDMEACLRDLGRSQDVITLSLYSV